MLGITKVCITLEGISSPKESIAPHNIHLLIPPHSLHKPIPYTHWGYILSCLIYIYNK